MKKRVLALLLTLIMVMSLIPTTAMAAQVTGEKFTIKIHQVDEKGKDLAAPIELTTTCKDKAGHSGYNHSIDLKEFHPSALGLPEKDWKGWSKGLSYPGKVEYETFFSWKSGTTSVNYNIVGKEPYQAATHIYLVYGSPAPTTYNLSVVTYPAGGATTGSGTYAKDATANISAKAPVGNTYIFQGWTSNAGGTFANPKLETTTFTMLGNAVTVTANYALDADNDGHPDSEDQEYNVQVVYNLKDSDPVEKVCEADRKVNGYPGEEVTLEPLVSEVKSGYSIDPAAGQTAKVMLGTDTTAAFTVSKDIPLTPLEPAVPTYAALKDLLGKITVDCTTENPYHEDKDGSYDLIEGSYDELVVSEKATGGYYIDVKVNADKYVDAYDTETDVEHSNAAPTSVTVRLVQNATGSWTKETATQQVKFTVACPEKPETVKIIFKVENGTWADGKTDDKEVEITKGATLGTNIPVGMKAAEGYEGGAWDVPMTTMIAAQNEDATYTYRFTKKAPEIVKTIKVNFFENATDVGTATKAIQMSTCTSAQPDAVINTPAATGSFVPEGKVLAGWKYAKNSEEYTGVYTYAELSKLLVATDWNENEATVNFIAVFEDAPVVEPETVTVTFNVGTHEHAKVEVVKGESVADAMPAVPTKDGFVFTGWADANGNPFVATTLVNENVNVFAQWVEAPVVEPETVTVTFNVGTHEHAKVEVVKGESVADAMPAAPTKDGFVFTGWADANGNPFVATTLVNENVNVFAQWVEAPVEPDKETFRVDFDSNGGTSVMSQIVVDGETVEKPADPTRSGYTFKGWYLDGERYDFDTAVTSNITLTAKWEEKDNGGSSSGGSGSGSSHSSGSGTSYTLKYDTNGGKSIKSESKSKPWEKDFWDLPFPVREGYRFNGWFLDEGLREKYRVEDDVDVDKKGVTTLYADWVKFEGFEDVPEDFWAYDAIMWAGENGYTNGESEDSFRIEDTFAPYGVVTREQMWMILARLSGETPADMAEAREWAMETEVSDGSNPTNFVTRQQMVAILYRYADLMDYDVSARADLTTFPDHVLLADYAKDPMAWSVANSIVGGTLAGTLDPFGNATRAQFITIIMRFCSTFEG